MSFRQSVLRPTVQTFLIASIATSTFIFAVSVVVGEHRVQEIVTVNQWLARDIASQFSSAAARSMSRAQKYGSLAKVESGSFDPSANREFESDTSVKAVWIVDPVGQGPVRPLAKLERDGIQETISRPEYEESLRRLVQTATEQGAGARGLGPGMSVIAVRLGDAPRIVLVFNDEALFARANGGPLGDKWMLMAPLPDKTEALLTESTSEFQQTEFPSIESISRLLTEQSPERESTEFTAPIKAASGAAFQVSAVQTGVFGVFAVAVSPLDTSVGFVPFLLQVALGVVLTLSLLVMLFRQLMWRRAQGPVTVERRAQAVPRAPEEPPPASEREF